MDGAERHVVRAPTDSDAELRGRQVGDFVLRECIGEGAFASVYRCDQPMLGREAVVKVLHHRLRGSDVVLQRFMREARLASRIDHPYAAHIYAFGVEPEDGLAWIAMEYVHGTSLEKWIEERGPLPLDMLVTFFEHVAEVVQNAHDHGIIHRDLKPSNVMIVERAGRIFPKLLDFGIAKLVDEAAMPGVPVEIDEEMRSEPVYSPSQSLTQANTTLGSPPYMSPEQWCEPLSVGPRSDLYSLGVMAYEALTGKQPFTGPTIAAIADLHCTAEIPTIGDRLPAAIDRVFKRALSKDPQNRPESALAFARELREAAQPPVRESNPQILRTEAIEAPRPVRKVWPLAAGAGALLASGVTAYILMAGGGEARRPPPSTAQVSEPAQPPLPQPSPAVLAAPVPAAAPTGPDRTAERPAEARAMVLVEIESTPRGAQVYRLPSETKVGATPWKAELPSEEGTQVFLIKKAGYADRRVEVDLRTGGKQTVKLPRSSGRPQPAGGSTGRRKGEPVNPFSTKSR